MPCCCPITRFLDSGQIKTLNLLFIFMVNKGRSSCLILEITASYFIECPKNALWDEDTFFFGTLDIRNLLRSRIRPSRPSVRPSESEDTGDFFSAQGSVRQKTMLIMVETTSKVFGAGQLVISKNARQHV